MIALTPDIFLLVALTGVTLYLTSHHTFLVVAGTTDRLHGLVAMWSGAALFQQATRFLHYSATDSEGAVFAMRFTFASVAILGIVGLRVCHSLTATVDRSTIDRVLEGASFALVGLSLVTELLVTSSTRVHETLVGSSFLWVESGPLSVLWLPWGLALLWRVVVLLQRSSALDDVERRMMYLALGVYVVTGVNDNLVGFGVLSTPVLFDYSFATLAVGLDALASRRQAGLRSQLERSFLDRTRDLQETAAALREAAAQARTESENKGLFLANTSHELRTPLNGLLAATDLLARSGLREDQARLAEIAEGSGEALRELVDGILDFTKISQGSLELRRQVIDLPALVGKALSVVGASAAAKGIVLSLRVEGRGNHAWGDARRVRQVVLNLLANAIRHSSSGEVTAIIRRVAAGGVERIRVEVADRGPGVVEEEVERLFRPFSQGARAAAGGTGLGLAIVRHLVDAMGGDAGGRARDGGGAAFWFELPPASQAKAAPTPEARGRVAIDTAHDDLRLSIETALRDAGYSVADAPGAGKLLGVIEGPDRTSDRIGVPVLRLALPGTPRALAAGDALLLPTVPMDIVTAFERVLEGLSPQAPTARPSASRAVGRKVLVVDDQRVNREVAGLALQELGCTVDVVSNGYEAVAAAVKQEYDAILMDIRMPGISGPEATQRIRAAEAGRRRVRIIALTAHAVVGERERCLEAGMDDFLVKPLSQDELLRVLSDGTEEPPAKRRPTGTTSQVRLAAMFRADSRQAFDALKAAYQDGDRIAIREHAHAIAGASASVRRDIAAQLARTIEQRALSGAIDDLDPLLDDLESSLTLTTRARQVGLVSRR